MLGQKRKKRPTKASDVFVPDLTRRGHPIFWNHFRLKCYSALLCSRLGGGRKAQHEQCRTRFALSLGEGGGVGGWGTMEKWAVLLSVWYEATVAGLLAEVERDGESTSILQHNNG